MSGIEQLIQEIQEKKIELQQVLKRKEYLAHENHLFTSFLKRTKSDDVDEKQEKSGRAKRKPKKAQNLSLRSEEKIHIATAEQDELTKQIELTKSQAENHVANLGALLELTDMHIAELKKEAYEFKRDIVIGAENFRTGKTMAEKVIKYMEDKLRQKDNQAEKLKLKNTTLRSQIAKVEQQLRQKEEMGDLLHFIDFHQLTIENKQFQQSIEERNKELLKLKTTTTNTVQKLNERKLTLKQLMEKANKNSSDADMKRLQVQNTTKDIARVRDLIRKAKHLNKSFRSTNSEQVKMPKTMDYVGQKAEEYELKKAIENWERKVAIAKLEFKTSKRKMLA